MYSLRPFIFPFKTAINAVFVLLLAATTLLGQNSPAENNKEQRDKPVECGCGNYWIAPEFETVRAGDTVTFELRSKSEKPPVGNGHWTISEGVIISGQGTERIIVQTTGNISATPQQAIPTPVEEYSVAFTFPKQLRRSPLNISADVKCETGETCPLVVTSIEIGRRSVEFNKPANVTDLVLSSEQLVTQCQPGEMPDKAFPQPSESMIIDVSTIASDPEGDVLTYNYTVSGGKIIGRGSDVKWDLSDASPGVYTITASADDGCGFCGKSFSKTVTVAECTPTCSLVECPMLELTAPDSISNAGIVIITANAGGGATDVGYLWSVENGQIIDGQGTHSLTVRLPANATKTKASVTVKLVGLDPAAACMDTATVVYENGIRKQTVN